MLTEEEKKEVRFCVICSHWCWLNKQHGVGACLLERKLKLQGDVCHFWRRVEDQGVVHR